MRLKHELADDDIGGLPAIPVSSSLKRADSDKRVVRTQSPDGLWRARTPQMFRYGVLRVAFARPGAEHAADEAQAVEALRARPGMVVGSTGHVKITYPEDRLLAAAVLSAERKSGSDT